MPETVDKFPTEYYETHEILTCPNGDKLRSDVDGIFCWMDGDRIPAKIVNGVVELLPVEKAAEAQPAKSESQIADPVLPAEEKPPAKGKK